MATYREFYEQSRQRRRRRQRRRILILFIIVLLVAAVVVAGGLFAAKHFFGGKADSKPTKTETPAVVATETPEPEITAEPMNIDTDEVLAPLPNMDISAENNTEWDTMGPVEQTLDYTLYPGDFRMTALPELGVVDRSYFNDATFVGDSLTQGLELYNTGLPNAHYCAYKGVGPNAFVNGATVKRADGTEEIALDALVASNPKYVYILLGTNVINSGNDDSFMAYFERMIDLFKENLPDDVVYYVQAIPPTRPEVAGKQAGLANEHIRAVNTRIAACVQEKGLNFVDLQEALADEDGNLRDEYAAADGIHMNPAGYQAWVDYLCSHTVYNKDNPYVYGSPYYLSGR